MFNTPIIYHSRAGKNNGLTEAVEQVSGWRRRVVLAAVALLGAVASGRAQAPPTSVQTLADSLVRQLPLVHDTTKVKMLLEVCKAYIGTKPKQAEPYGQKALTLARQLGWQRGIALAHARLGSLYTSTGNFPKAQTELLRALGYWQKLGDQRRIASVTHSMSIVLTQANEHRRAEQWALRTLRLAETQHDSARMSEAFSLLGTAAVNQGHLHEGLYWNTRALKMDRLRHQQKDIPLLINNLADVYIRLGKPYLALRYLAQALPMARKATANKQTVSSYNQYLLAITLSTSAQAYAKIRQPARALPYTLEALTLATGIGSNDLEAEIMANLTEIYAALGQYERAYYYTKRQAELQKKLFSSTKAQRFADMQTRYETREKEQSIQLLTQRNQLLKQRNRIQQLSAEHQRSMRNAALLSSGLLLLAVGVIYNRYQLRQRTVAQLNAQAAVLERQALEKSLLLKEVHHRVKNNLQIVLSLLHSQLRTLQEPAALNAIRESQSRVQTMSLIHQNLYQTDSLARIDMRRYLAELLDAIQRTFRDEAAAVEVELAIEPVQLNTHTAVPLGLIVNELVTNALKYAFPNVPDKHLLVRLQPEGPATFRLTVADNGIGMPALNLEEIESLGLRLVIGLLDQIGATFSIHREAGTRLDIVFHEVTASEPDLKD